MELLDPWSLGLYRCALAGWRHACGSGWHRHHILSRHDLQNNDKAWKYCDQDNEEIFTAMVCGNANAVLKLADTKWAQAVLVKGKIHDFGYDYVKEVWDDIPGKVSYPRLEAILANYPTKSS